MIPAILLRGPFRYPRDPFPRDPSADEARRELSKQIYQERRPSPVVQVFDWLDRRINEVLDRASNASPGGNIGLLILVLLFVGVVVAVLLWFGPLSRSTRRRREATEVTPTESRDEHRSRADAFAAAGRYAEAVRERLRAIIRGLADHGVIEDRPGRTAAEVAVEAGQALPSVEADLLEAATVFAEIWYGGHQATAEHDGRMREIDDRVAAARPGDKADSAAEPAWAAPGSEW